MSAMTDLLHNPGLWNSMIIVGVLVLLGESAWRSWHLEGRVDDPARLWPRPAPARLAYAFGPAEGPRAGSAYRFAVAAAAVRLDTSHGALEAVAENDGRGATEEWSPAAEQVTAGRSLEDWWSERLQAYDAALKWIDTAPRLPDGTGAFVVLGNTVAEELDLFVSRSQRLHAYRELRIGQTGEFTTRQHMELEALVSV
jgi:hypothetical protein